MRINSQIFIFLFTILIFISCDKNRLFEQNDSFNNKFWHVDSVHVFDFKIDDKESTYNLYLNVRNSSNYPYNNVYVKYMLEDSLNTVLEEQLINNKLFDSKTGKPLGQSGIGDIFDSQFLLHEKYSFQQKGKYFINLQQYMRTDTLTGILAVGIRVEKNRDNE